MSITTSETQLSTSVKRCDCTGQVSVTKCRPECIFKKHFRVLPTSQNSQPAWASIHPFIHIHFLVAETAQQEQQPAIRALGHGWRAIRGFSGFTNLHKDTLIKTAGAEVWTALLPEPQRFWEIYTAQVLIVPTEMSVFYPRLSFSCRLSALAAIYQCVSVAVPDVTFGASPEVTQMFDIINLKIKLSQDSQLQ